MKKNAWFCNMMKSFGVCCFGVSAGCFVCLFVFGGGGSVQIWSLVDEK